MFSLRGIFPDPQKVPQKNFIKENVRQLRTMQNNRVPVNKSRQVHGVKKEKVSNKLPISASAKESVDEAQRAPSKDSTVNAPAKSEPSNRTLRHPPKISEVSQIRKADMSEFLRRRNARDSKPPHVETEYYKQSTDNVSTVKDVGCQHVDPDSTHFFADVTKIRVIFPSKKILESLDRKGNQSFEMGDTSKTEKCKLEKPPILKNKRKEPVLAGKVVQSRYLSNTNLNEPSGPEHEHDTHRSTFSLNSSMKLDSSTSANVEKNPLLPPPTYQKGVVPKYIKEIKQKIEHKKELSHLNDFGEMDPQCPPGHIALPESERIETLKILKDKFSALIIEMNKMPVRTDTLRMRNRKMVLDKELAKLEDGIKVFSRSRVYVNLET